MGSAALELEGPAAVLTGDTLELEGERVRLHGIDAPSLTQRCRRDSGVEWRCGLLARMELTRRIDARALACNGETRDAFGQRLVTCRVEDLTLEAWLVEGGWALAASPEHAEAEARARSAGRGLWHDGFEPSADWRFVAGLPHGAADEGTKEVCACAERHKSFARRRQP